MCCHAFCEDSKGMLWTSGLVEAMQIANIGAKIGPALVGLVNAHGGMWFCTYRWNHIFLECNDANGTCQSHMDEMELLPSVQKQCAQHKLSDHAASWAFSWSPRRTFTGTFWTNLSHLECLGIRKECNESSRHDFETRKTNNEISKGAHEAILSLANFRLVWRQSLKLSSGTMATKATMAPASS